MMTFQAHTKKWLIITDLDGTLLDHDSYSFADAKASLKQLENNNIPVLINSSKTQAEISHLRKKLNNQHPFIIENGSAILTPQSYFDKQHSQSLPLNLSLKNKHAESFDNTVLGLERKEILNIIPILTKKFNGQFISYSQSTVNNIIEMTGLSYENAQQSLIRHYTEPVKWLGNSTQKQAFIDFVNSQGIYTLQGGRFIHLMGDTDKGKALNNIKKKYIKYYNQVNTTHGCTTIDINTVALGDSHNDIAMLQAADIAIVIRSPHYPAPEFEHPHKIISDSYGPKGWHECIQQLIFNQERAL